MARLGGTLSLKKPTPTDVTPDATPPARGAHDELLAGLMKAVVAGCGRSFETLHGKTRRRLYLVVDRIIANRSETEEVLQEVYLTAWLQRDKFDLERGQVASWLSTIARSHALDSLRRRKCRPQALPHAMLLQQDDDAESACAKLVCPAPDPQQALLLRRESETLQRCVNQLPAAQREALSLAYYQDCSHDEVSRKLGRPLGTVKTWIRRSLLSLRAEVAVQALVLPAKACHAS